MKGSICITDLIEHMVHETKHMFTGMNYEGNGFFYHDALSQMMNKDMKEWMRVQHYYEMWILPHKGVQCWISLCRPTSWRLI